MKTAFLAHYLVDACEFASDEEARHYLRGAVIEPSGHIAATDGHALFAGHMAHDAESFVYSLDGARIVPKNKDLLKAAKAAGRDPAARYLVIEHAAPDAMRATFRIVFAKSAADACGDALVAFTCEGEFIDGAYIDWRRILPKLPKDGKPIAAAPAFNARDIARFGAVSQSAKNTTRKGALHRVRIIPCEDECAPFFIDLGREDAFGVLMPMRPGQEEIKELAEDGKSERRTGLHKLPTAPAWVHPAPKPESANSDAPSTAAA